MPTRKKTPAPQKRGRGRPRKYPQGYVDTHVWLDPALHRALGITAAAERRPVTDMIGLALSRYIGLEGPPEAIRVLMGEEP